MTSPCPGDCGHTGPAPEAFRLYDVLNCAAQAVDERASGCSLRAESAWLEACIAAAGLFTPGSEADNAIAVIITACGPAGPGDPPAAASLRKGLDAAAWAVLTARMTGGPAAARMLAAAAEAAELLPPDQEAALTVILAQARAVSRVSA